MIPLLVLGLLLFFNTTAKAMPTAKINTAKTIKINSIGISKDAKILTLWAYPQNTPFILMNRKGYTEMFDKEDKIEIGLSFDYDYVVIENELLEDDKKKRYLSDLNYVSDNGKISVFCQF